jgi:hypothetical protein
MTSIHETFFFVDVVDQPHLDSFFEGDGFAGGAKLQGAGLADQSRQALGAAHAGHDAEVDFGEADAAAFLFGDADVAGHGDFQAAALTAWPLMAAMTILGVFSRRIRTSWPCKREIILEAERLFGQHVDVGAGGEKFLDFAGDDDGMDVVVEAGIE